MNKINIDHLGNEYTSEIEMCAQYNINPATYRGRIRNGWTKEDALTKEARGIKRSPTYIDHLGNAYKDQKSMCKHYGIEPDLFVKRISNGMSLKDALTTPIRKRIKAPILIDHLGNAFSTQTKMCEHYKIDINTFRKRILSGWTLKEALTKHVNRSNKNI